MKALEGPVRTIRSRVQAGCPNGEPGWRCPLRAALWDGPYGGCFFPLRAALWDGPYGGCFFLRAALWDGPYIDTDGLGDGLRFFLGHQGRDDTVVDGSVDSLFIRKLDFRLGRMDVDVDRRRVDMEMEHGKGIARFRQHGVISIVDGLEHQRIMDNAVIDDTRLPVAVAL